MDNPLVRRGLTTLTIGLAALGASSAGPPGALGGVRPHLDPAQILPLDQIAAAQRDSVAEVIASNTFHRQGAPDTFPCHPKIYLSLINEPALTLALWKDLSTSPVHLQQVGPDQYRGTDGAGTTATWEFVYRSPKLHVLLCHLDYVSPRGNAKVEGRVVLIARTDYFRESHGEPWIRHNVEAFVKIDSKGWRTIAKTARPIIEKVLEDQVQEAGWFISLMGRLVEMYPNWAAQVAAQGPGIRPEVRQSFRELVIQNRKPGAFTGRPTLAENTQPASRTR